MIDRNARESLAESLRQLATGAITNLQFEERAPEHSKVDPAIFEIFYGVAWPRYDDFSEQRMIGESALTLGERKDVARCVLFLKSDFEYLWPNLPVLSRLKFWFLALIGFKKNEPKTAGDRRVWPFWTMDQYQMALSHPPYLK